MSYFNDPKYDVEVLKWYILNNENMSPTRYVQDLFVMDYTAANKKLNRGTYTRDELKDLGNHLGMSKDDFMTVFFPDMTGIPEE